ncbi:hypothetical protein [Paludisphaera borealis]|uniref:hypothetical protein n=1 Tax=Paludisphaera borealis TaxID=1387353 RepID=UPI0009706450|nr:hypothetical protein [Paludisphaera borealis]
MKVLLAASLVAGTSLLSGTAKADFTNLSTGASLTGNIDNNWTVVFPGQTNNQLETIAPGFPSPPWLSDAPSDASHWLVPVQYGQYNAPPSSGSPIDYVYTTSFTLNADQLASASLSGQWASDNNTVSIKLNGGASLGSNSAANSYTTWSSLTTTTTGFVLGLNTLEFHVANLPSGGNNPTGFRFEGGVTSAAVPEPASLVMSAVSTLMLGGLSWKRRLARRAV